MITKDGKRLGEIEDEFWLDNAELTLSVSTSGDVWRASGRALAHFLQVDPVIASSFETLLKEPDEEALLQRLREAGVSDDRLAEIRESLHRATLTWPEVDIEEPDINGEKGLGAREQEESSDSGELKDARVERRRRRGLDRGEQAIRGAGDTSSYGKKGRGDDTSETTSEPTDGTIGGFKKHGEADGKAEKKKQRSRLRTYVTDEAAESDAEPDSAAAAQRSEIEKAGVSKVMQQERDNGREPTEMPPMNEGYDIESKDPSGRVERYIEVKSTEGDWGSLGVALTKAEFRKASELKDKFWLYIVERANDETAEIHRIQDPARKVNQFIYDDGWRGVAQQHQEEPAAGYLPGRKVQVADRGLGEIVAVTGLGIARQLIVNFPDVGEVRLPFNIKTIELIED